MDKVGLILAIAAVLGEFALSLNMVRWYFVFGLPLLVLDVACPHPVAEPPTPEELVAALPPDGAGGWVIASLEPRRYAFREQLWGSFFRFTYTPLMHATLSFDHDHARVRVIGRLNIFPAVFFAIVLISTRGDRDLSFVYFFIGLIVALYLIQAWRFRGVARVAARIWRMPPLHPSAAPSR